MNHHIALVLLAAGTASIAHAADELPEQLLHAEHAQGRLIAPSRLGPVKHVYYHVGTGETIISSVKQGQTVAADSGSSELIWSVNLLTHQCDGINDYSGISAIGFGDDIDGTDPWDVGGTWQSMGDIAPDTVVDCIGFNYWTAHADVDNDNDGNGDGIPGFGVLLDWWDSDNGLGTSHCTRLPLIQITLGGLEGGIDTEPGFYAGFLYTVDLSADNLGVDLTMEIGDSDDDPQGAAVYNSGVGELGNDYDLDGNDDADIDGDGLFDWTRGMRFIQPGTYDFDGDGILDGDVADQADTAIGMGKPAGYTLVQDAKSGDWGWEIDLDAPAVATGARSFTSVFLPPDPVTGDIIHSGFVFNFAGFADDGSINPPSCDADAFVPAAVIAHDLYGPIGFICEPWDYNCDGLTDFFDVSDFLDDFANGADYNGDGSSDFFDVSDFLDDFTLGAP